VAGRRRRTPGLRREEVAQLADVGVTWYTWLEQGRDIGASTQVLTAISNALQLDPHERSHLFTLAGLSVPVFEDANPTIAPTVRLMLDKLEPYPACVLNGRFDILAYNRSYNLLVGGLDDLPFNDRNCIWLAFTNKVWRSSIVDWEAAVSRMVAGYRAAMAEHVAEPAWRCLIKRLHDASPEFTEMWERHEVRQPENRTKQFDHADVGLLRFDFAYLWLGERFGSRLVTYTPADLETAARLEELRRRAPSVAA